MLFTSDICITATCLTDSRLFLYEVEGLRRNTEAGSLNVPVRRSGRMSLVVPYSRMGQEMRRITRLGGKIVSIRPLQRDGLCPTEGYRQTDEGSAAELGWWLEISTQNPPCTLFFGPYDSDTEAESLQPGYVEDLSQEGAEGIASQVKWCQPQQLTVLEVVGV
jgi:hypothetical protein